MNGGIDIFAEAPMLDIEIPDFDLALDRAVLDQHDELAFSALTTHLERAREQGDLTRLYEMSMVLGATACLHDHLQSFASSFDAMSENVTEGTHDDHDHGHEEDDDSEIDPLTGRKRKKRRG